MLSKALTFPPLATSWKWTLFAFIAVNNHIRHVRSPLTGRVLELNEDIQDNPSLIHLSPHKNWLFKMEYDDQDELDLLMSSAQYTRFLDQL